MANEKPELLLALGELELARKRFTAARDAFRRAVNLDPANDRALAAAGLLAASMEDYASAKEFLDRAIKANGTLFEARVVRAQLALLEKDPQEAANQVLRALQVRPQDPWASGWLGVAYLAVGDVAAAQERLEQAARANQEFTLFYAESLLRQGKGKQVLELLRADQPNPQAQLLRARALLQLGQNAEALELLQRLARLLPTDGAIRYVLGYAQFQQRQWQEAVATFEAAASLAGAPAFTAQAANLAAKALAAQNLLDAAEVPPPPPPKR
jgi:tetratricopeptide (TPR) repeat protein